MGALAWWFPLSAPISALFIINLRNFTYKSNPVCEKSAIFDPIKLKKEKGQKRKEKHPSPSTAENKIN